MAISLHNTPLAQVVEEACRAESNIFGYGIWTHHILSVVAYGKQLADLGGADAGIVEIAALLHDYASIKDQAMYRDHHLHGPREAERLLHELGYPSTTIVAVKKSALPRTEQAHRQYQGAKKRFALPALMPWPILNTSLLCSTWPMFNITDQLMKAASGYWKS